MAGGRTLTQRYTPTMAKLPALPYVRTGVTEGQSANQAYREYQSTAHSQGLQGMRRQDFLRIYSETRNAREQTQRTMNLPRGEKPGAGDIAPRSTINARGYGTWVGVHQRTSGQEDYIFTPFLVKSNQPITPEEAEQRAQEYLAQQPDEYNRVTLGIGYLITEQFSPLPR